MERDEAVRLLTERAILTRMVCRELADSDIRGSDRRPQTALFLLLRWIGENQSKHVHVEPRADDGLEQMVVPEGYAELVPEIEAGAKVCNALFMLFTADNGIQAENDCAVIERLLAAYWERRPLPIPIRR